MRAGLILNSKKCIVGRINVKFLGFDLLEGVLPSEDNFQAKILFPRPQTKKRLSNYWAK